MRDESEAHRGASEIATCLFLFLHNLPRSVSKVTCFSDTCGGQNRNHVVASMFLFAAQYFPWLNK